MAHITIEGILPMLAYGAQKHTSPTNKLKHTEIPNTTSTSRRPPELAWRSFVEKHAPIQSSRDARCEPKCRLKHVRDMAQNASTLAWYFEVSIHLKPLNQVAPETLAVAVRYNCCQLKQMFSCQMEQHIAPTMYFVHRTR